MDAAATALLTTVEGRTSDVVTVTGITATVKSRHARRPGSFLTCSGGRGETGKLRVVDIDLDSSSPKVSFDDLNGRPTNSLFTVRKGQTENFLITAHTNASDVTWNPNVQLVVGGRHIDFPIRIHGRELETTASTAATADRWQSGRWQPRASTGGPAAGDTVPAGAKTACQVLDTPAASALLGAPSTRTPGIDRFQGGHGLKVPMQSSLCTYSETAGSTGSATGGATVILLATADPTAAAKEYAAQRGQYSRSGTRLTPVAGIGNQAAAGRGLVLAQSGRFLLNVQVSRPTSSTDPAGQQRLMASARRVAKEISS